MFGANIYVPDCNAYSKSALSKLLPIDVLLSDPEVAAGFRLDTLERKAGYALMRGLAAQLDGITGTNTFARSTIPDNVRISCVRSGHTVVVEVGADPYIIDPDGNIVLILPADFRWSDLLAVLHVLDRGSVGRCAVWHGGTKGRLLWMWKWGPNHDDWNAVKGSAKSVAGGRIWAAIVKLSGIVNIHVGPFKSGAWGRQLREVHKKLVGGLLSPESDKFAFVAQKQFELDGFALMRGLERGEWVDNYWQRFVDMRFVKVFMYIIKFARWGSIDDAWGWIRPEIWLLQPCYEALRDERKVGEGADLNTGLGTAQYDTEAHDDAANPKGGLIERASRNITDEVCLCMDIYSVVAGPVRTRQAKRAKERKSVEKGLEHELDLLSGLWENMYKEIVGGLASGSQHLQPWDDDRFKPMDVASLYFAFMTCLVKELSLRELPELFGPLNRFLGLLGGGELALEYRASLVKMWRRVLKVEELASRGNVHARVLLADIPFLEMQFLRLGMYVCCRDASRHPDKIGEDALLLGASVGRRMFDEKGQEDLHQFVRDLSRSKRDKSVGISTCFAAVRSSGVLEARGVAHPELDASRVAQEAFTTRRKSKYGYPNQPKVWDPRLNSILSSTRDWPSPTTSGLMTGYLAWDFLQACFELDPEHAEDADGPRLAARWWSGHVPELKALHHEMFDLKVFILHRCRWAFTCVELEAVYDMDGEAFQLGTRPRAHTDLIKTLYIEDPREWTVWTPEVRWLAHEEPRPENASIGIAFPMPDCRPTLLQDVLSRRTPLTVDELGLALSEFKLVDTTGCPALAGLSRQRRLELLVKHAGFSDPEAVLAHYAAPAPPGEPPRSDPELDGLLEELAEDLADNAADLKAFRGELRQKSARHIANERAKARGYKVKRLKAWRAKRALKKKAPLKLRPVRVLKKRPRPEPGAAPPPPSQPGLPPGPPPAGPTGTPPVPPAAPPDTPPVSPPPDAPAEAVRRPGRKPKAENGWEVVELPDGHGWIRFHPERGNIDGHCAYHTKCKLDRRAKHCTLGLVAAWAARGARDNYTKERHHLDRIALSLELTFAERESARDVLGASTDPLMEQLVEMERAQRGGDGSEPESIFIQASHENRLDAYVREMEA